MLNQISFSIAAVMDKEPRLVTIWIAAIVLALLGIVASAFRWWLGVIVAVVAAIASLAVVLEIYDPFVGPAIREEAGMSYVVLAQVAVVLGFAVPLSAAGIAKRRASQHPNVPTS